MIAIIMVSEEITTTTECELGSGTKKTQGVKLPFIS